MMLKSNEDVGMSCMVMYFHPHQWPEVAGSTASHPMHTTASACMLLLMTRKTSDEQMSDALLLCSALQQRHSMRIGDWLNNGGPRHCLQLLQHTRRIGFQCLLQLCWLRHIRPAPALLIHTTSLWMTAPACLLLLWHQSNAQAPTWPKPLRCGDEGCAAHRHDQRVHAHRMR